jgi:cytoskeletal protein CcmA (bactofilin family)
MTRLGRTVIVRGEVAASDDISIEGTIDGPVWCEGHAVTIAETASIHGDVVGRDITVAGVVDGTLLAQEVVEIRTTANVTGRVVSTRLILHEGGTFHGEVEPQQVAAAMTVARHRRKDDKA